MENRLPEVGELWAWVSRVDGKHQDMFLIIGEPLPEPKTQLLDQYADPYTLKVMWIDDGDIGPMFLDRADMHLHIQRVA
jgi:hypothetical protein